MHLGILMAFTGCLCLYTQSSEGLSHVRINTTKFYSTCMLLRKVWVISFLKLVHYF